MLGQLLLAAVAGEGVAGQGVDADAEADGQPGRRELLQNLQIDLVRLVAAAELLGLDQPQQPGLGQQGEQLAGEVPGGLLLGGPGLDLPFDQLADERNQVAGLLGGQLAFHRLRAVVGHGGALLSPVQALRRRAPGCGGAAGGAAAGRPARSDREGW
ncbi:hypothetical protein SSPO_021560 [Streptomyces antimycoticus]|uniref:Uncharacterized protein n=1 Tax=Streptomyces antimycoticus TaxID=68175 RepID=A0A499UIP6_9ACTN|nr:hypothetical protein SSPO_021560 [Streptomyces antimycoticus]